MVRLPQIPEDAPRAQRKKLKSSELSKELVVLPLLVQLEREPQIRAKKPAGNSDTPLMKAAHGSH